jgi:hypothetical protein
MGWGSDDGCTSQRETGLTRAKKDNLREAVTERDEGGTSSI